MGSVLNKPKVNLFGMSKRKSLMFTDMGRTQQMKKHLRQKSIGPVQQGWLLTVPQKAHMKALYFFHGLYCHLEEPKWALFSTY